MFKTIFEEKAWFNMVATLLGVTVFAMVVIFAFGPENTGNRSHPTQTTSSTQHAHHNVSANVQSARTNTTTQTVSHKDYFTNFGNYMPRTHCLLTAEGKTDWFWVITMVVLNVGIIIAYLRIYYFWCKAYIMVPRQDRNTKLMDLAQLFLWCAITSYVSAIVIFVWPAYRLVAICLLVLNIWSWRFAFNLKSFGVSFSARKYQRLARTDQLTTLLNRHAIQKYLSRKAEQYKPQHSLTVLFLDFDRFKIINDTYGHDAGDQLLISISRRLCEVMNKVATDTVEYQAARIGGDEFVITIFTELQEIDLNQIATDLLNAFNNPHRIGSYEIHSTASIGVVEYQPDYPSIDQFIKDADTAMYHAKQKGKNCIVFFDETMRQSVLRREELSRDLYQAISSHSIRYLYQPVLDLNTGSTVAIETSMTWEHPKYGQIDSNELYQLAHANGLKSTLEKTMIHFALRQLKRWTDGQMNAQSPVIQMPISRHLMFDDHFVDWMLELAKEENVPFSKINLIIDADTIDSDFEDTMNQMNQLVQAGIQFVLSIDGLSYASLGTLHNLPIHEIRIAHPTTNEPIQKQNSLALLYALITLATNLDLKTSIRHITHLSQLAIVQSFGCQYGLGQLFLENTTSDAMTIYLMSRHPFPPIERSNEQAG